MLLQGVSYKDFDDAINRYDKQISKVIIKGEKFNEIRLKQLRAMEKNQEIENALTIEKNLLCSSLNINRNVNFEMLKWKAKYPIPHPKLTDFTDKVKKPGRLLSFSKKAKRKFEEEITSAKIEYESELVRYERARKVYLLKVRRQNQEIDLLKTSCRSGDPRSISKCCTYLLIQSDYPYYFPKIFQNTFFPLSNELVIDYQLISISNLPKIASYKYIKSSNLIKGTPHTDFYIKKRYVDIILSTCLRTIYEIFNSDIGEWINVVTFNGYVPVSTNEVNPDMKDYFISIRASKSTFIKSDLHNIDKVKFLKNLGAQFSIYKNTFTPITPITNP